MPARRPHHRSIWEGTDRASRAFHQARRDAADRVLVQFVDEMVHGCRPGEYRHDPGLALRARQAADTIRPYLEHEIEEPQE